MPVLICGSLAFDSIATFPGRFAEQILADQLHILNVSFLVPTLRREFGGCAGNIAYNVAQLGGRAVVLAAAGHDGQAYVERLQGLGVDVSNVHRVETELTAQAFIITDADNNQITAFHPGAMQAAHEKPVPARDDLALAIVAPDGREAMLRHADQLAAAGVPFIFDPGQGLPMFDGEELNRFVERASWIAVNDYEARMLEERCGRSIEAMASRPGLRGAVVTLGAAGCEVWEGGRRVRIEGLAATEVVDPTGCGDAFRAGLLVGLERGWTLERSARLGNRLGALKIAHRGGQNHVPDRTFRED